MIQEYRDKYEALKRKYNSVVKRGIEKLHSAYYSQFK
jgi:hypothetical protein